MSSENRLATQLKENDRDGVQADVAGEEEGKIQEEKRTEEVDISGLACRLGPEIDLEAVGQKIAEPTEEERELANTRPANQVYRRFPVVGLDWDALRNLHQGDAVFFPLPGGAKASGIVNLVDTRPGQPFGIGGNLLSGMQGTFSLVKDPLVGVRGFLLPAGGDIAFRFSEENGEVFLDEVDKNAIVCHGMPKAIVGAASAVFRSGVAGNPAVPLLQSRSGALGVLYIDLDGEIVTDPDWNGGATINATAPVFSDSNSIVKLWQEVSEAYAPFNINVTTDVTVYNNATPGRRMRIIVTSNNWVGAGGVALLNSFQWSGTTPCWAFNGASNLDANIHLCAMTISHEFGHTFGLWHDGLLPANPNSNDVGAYYQGHMTPVGGWGPIMGAPFPVDSRYVFPIRPIVQWSMGDYAGTNASSANIFTQGNNTQNDVGIIAGPLNQVGYVQDDFNNTEDLATAIPQDPANSGIISVPSGLIHADGDVDVFRIDLQQGLLQVAATSGTPVSPCLKTRLTLINSDRVTTNTFSDPGNLLSASINTNLPTGTYYLRVEGVGTTTNTSTTNGFIGYGSIGQYKLTGSFQNLPRPPGDNFPDECIRLDPPVGNFINTSTVLGATAQVGERGYVSGKARNTIWYSWVSPGSGVMNIDTMGSSFDTTLAVCAPAAGKANTLANLVLLAANDNASPSTNASALKFQAVAGVPYYFVIDSAKGVAGTGGVILHGAGNLSSGRPANDDYAKATTLSGVNFSVGSSLLAGTAEANEPSLAGLAATRSVWFRWASPTNGRLSLNTRGSGCDTVLGVYTGSVTGSSWSNLKLLSANDNITASDTNSALSLVVSNGINYVIKVDSRRSASGDYRLSGEFLASPVLSAPSSINFVLSKTKTNGAIYQPQISWNRVSGALGYEVAILKGITRIYAFATTNGSVTNWGSGPALFGTGYGAQIRAYSNNLFSPWSQVVTNTIK